jgi:isocitrate/isopropylmalate dehydrogenase
MTTFEILHELQRRGVQISATADGKLHLSGTGPRLPEELREAIIQHKETIVAALGQDSSQPASSRQAAILAAVREHHPAWRSLRDEDLLCLLDFAVYWKGVGDGQKEGRACQP